MHRSSQVHKFYDAQPNQTLFRIDTLKLEESITIEAHMIESEEIPHFDDFYDAPLANFTFESKVSNILVIRGIYFTSMLFWYEDGKWYKMDSDCEGWMNLAKAAPGQVTINLSIGD